MRNIAFITPPGTEFGFSLSGIPQFVTEPHDLEGTLKNIIADQDTGLVIVDERMINGMTEERLRDVEHAWRGIVLILPSPVKPPAEVEDYAARLIRRAIGYHVRLKI